MSAGPGSFLLAVALGVLAAGVAVGWFRSYGPDAERRLWAVGLLVAAVIYLGFAAFGGASTPWILLEVGGVGLFGALALAGQRTSGWFLALGWALHLGWDMILHGHALHGHGLGSGTVTPFVPTWYPPLCLGFDLVVAGYWVYRLR